MQKTPKWVSGGIIDVWFHSGCPVLFPGWKSCDFTSTPAGNMLLCRWFHVVQLMLFLYDADVYIEGLLSLLCLIQTLNCTFHTIDIKSVDVQKRWFFAPQEKEWAECCDFTFILLWWRSPWKCCWKVISVDSSRQGILFVNAQWKNINESEQLSHHSYI